MERSWPGDDASDGEVPAPRFTAVRAWAQPWRPWLQSWLSCCYSGMSASIQHIVRDATADSMFARIRPYAIGNRCDPETMRVDRRPLYLGVRAVIRMTPMPTNAACTS